MHKFELAPQYDSYVLDGKSLVYKRPVRSQIFLKQMSALIDFDLVKQLITIVTVLSENDRNCFKAHSKYIFELAKYVIDCVEQRPAQLPKSAVENRGDINCIVISNFITELTLKSSSFSKGSQAILPALFSITSYLFEQRLIVPTPQALGVILERGVDFVANLTQNEFAGQCLAQLLKIVSNVRAHKYISQLIQLGFECLEVVLSSQQSVTFDPTDDNLNCFTQMIWKYLKNKFAELENDTIEF